MCTWINVRTPVVAHAKGVAEWTALTTASVSYDHPTSVHLEHALIIDLLDQRAGPGSRVAIELTPESARALVRAIETALDAGEREEARMAAALALAGRPHRPDGGG